MSVLWSRAGAPGTAGTAIAVPVLGDVDLHTSAKPSKLPNISLDCVNCAVQKSSCSRSFCMVCFPTETSMVLYALRKHKNAFCWESLAQDFVQNTKVMSRGKKVLGKGGVRVLFSRTDSHEGGPALWSKASTGLLITYSLVMFTHLLADCCFSSLSHNSCPSLLGHCISTAHQYCTFKPTPMLAEDLTES